MPEHQISKFIRILAQERAAILATDFAAVSRLATVKTALFDGLNESDISPDDLLILKVDLSRNQSLLKAAISGITQAHERLAALETVRESLSTYDKNGEISRVEVASPAMERKL
jgi:hypothetical protein